MAEVTGKTSETIDVLMAHTVDSVQLNDQGQLSFTRKNGVVVNGGTVGNYIVSAIINSAKRLILTTKQGTQLDAGSVDTSDPLRSWPVGCLFFNTTTANPNTLLGGGTWEAFGQGRTIIGVDPSDASFDAVEETGGSKSKTLVAANLPPHVHTMAHNHEPVDPTDNFLINSPGGTQNRADRQSGQSGFNASGNTVTGPSSAPNTGSGPGTSQSFDVLNPYITVYIWKRTA